MSRRTKRKTKNKKVKNATANEYDGISFRSKLETYTYKRLKENELSNFEYEHIAYEIIEGFEYQGEKLRPVKIKPDFISTVDKVVIECKGWATDKWELKWKLFKRYLKINNMIYDLYVVKNQGEVNSAIQSIKDKLKNK